MSIEPQHLDTRSNPPSNGTLKSRGKTLLKWGIFLLVVIAIIVLIWRHFHDSTAGGQNKGQGQGRRGGGLAPGQVMPVQAKVLVSGDLHIFIDALGNVVPPNSITVHTQISGQLMSVNFKEGQTVRKGDVLFQVDPRPYQVALMQAQGQLAKDTAALAGAKQDLARYQSEKGIVSLQQIDDQRATVSQDEAALKVDQGQIASAQLNLVYCRVTSPVDGKLGLRLVDPGNIVNTSDSTGVVVINQFQPMNVTYAIPEDNVQSVLKQVHAGNTLGVDALDRANQNVLDHGQLLSLDNEIDPTTGTLKLKAQFPNTAENLFPSQFVNIHMLVETQHNVTLLPSAAIQRGSLGTYVYVVNADSTVTATPVTLGAVDGDNTGVLKGVSAGQQVVFDGADKLKDGAKVKVIDPNKPAAQGADGAGAASDAASGNAASGHHGHHHHDAAS